MKNKHTHSLFWLYISYLLWQKAFKNIQSKTKDLLIYSLLFFSCCATMGQDNLQAYFPFNGNANDVKDGAYTGIVNGATLSTDRNGYEYSAYYFDGAAYITINADDSVLNVRNTGYSVSFWVKPHQNQTIANAPVVSFGYGNAGGYGIGYWEQYGMFRTSFYNNSWSGIYVSQDELDDYDWYMHTFTFDGDTLKQYINDEIRDQTVGSYYAATPAGTYSYRIGAESKYVNNFFKGTVDDLRIFYKELSAAEIDSLYDVSDTTRYGEIDCESIVFSPFATANNTFTNTGSIVIDSIKGNGKEPFSYLWSNSETTSIINNLLPGTYSVVVSDDNGCTSTESWTIQQLHQCDTISINISGSVTHQTDSALGAIDVTIAGNGIDPLNYIWSNGATTEDLTNIVGDNYSLTVTDNAGCTANASFEVMALNLSLNDSLLLYFPFTGNAADSSGNGHNGTVVGATLAPDRFGNANSAFYFDGNDYISVDGTNLQAIDSSGYTVALWVKPNTGQTSNWANIASYGDYGNGGFTLICVEPYNGLYVERIHTNSGTNAINFDSDRTNLTVWSMLAFTYKNGIMKGYLNGVLIEEMESMGYSEPGFDLIIGASASLGDYFIGWVDDVRIYNRALSNIELANLSGLSGAVRATEFNAYSLADFELSVLEPIKESDYWAVWGASMDPLSYITVVENPLKSGPNTSEYVGTSVTFPTGINTYSTPRKKEYVLTSEDGTAYDHHHIMQWKFLLYDSTLLKLDTIMWDWMCFNQIHQGYELYDGGECEYGGSIAYGGGIFNDNAKAHSSNNAIYEFQYRAMPDSAKIPYIVDIGKWMTFTYEIFWTQSNTGFWRLWKDGELLSSAYNVKTVADCAPEDGDFLQFKVGQYNKWNDSEIDSFPVYFDDIEIYIDPENDGVSVFDICPECIGQTPDNLSVSDSTIVNGETACFNAHNIITVAGDQTSVEILSGASANFIAEQAINILPGFHAMAGSYVNVNITTDGSFCADLTSSIVNSQFAIKNNATETPGFVHNKTSEEGQKMKVFPNPNIGEFTIQLINCQNELVLSVYNSLGILVHQLTTKNDKNTINLSNLKRGIYFVIARGNGTLLTQKILIQ